ncbi:GDP-L-fucose synthase [Salegentibacter sp. Hel_I_6]|uniref:GDP-L-fucose synthase family protein n=1 Tax=Salegentibacter sp. Hel_I_6 TaxID=1250278 RepID=UPI000568703A|nr:GDP-L-fucose synthase [Salegentibacter sp. Hel_I_6]
MNKSKKIYIAGHTGMAGSAIWRHLEKAGYTNLIGRTSAALDLENQKTVAQFFNIEKPEVLIIAAAKVGGILANIEQPYDFLMKNLLIQNNLIENAHRFGVQKLIFLGSSCIYPKFCAQPIKEDYLLTGTLEPTNESYAIAKIAGLKACEALRNQFDKDFVSLMPTNLYGEWDNFDLNSSHVIPAMIKKFHEAKLNDQASVTLWGTGTPMREFMYVKDLASAVCFALENNLEEPVYNVGVGEDLSIKDLALLIQKVTGHKGEIVWDVSKPDGTPRKILDIQKLNALGWSAQTQLEEGLKMTYKWFLKRYDKL